jgi:hypothetical protein
MENDKGIGASKRNDNDNISLINKLRKGALDAATSMRLIAQYTTAFITSQVMINSFSPFISFILAPLMLD